MMSLVGYDASSSENESDGEQDAVQPISSAKEDINRGNGGKMFKDLPLPRSRETVTDFEEESEESPIIFKKSLNLPPPKNVTSIKDADSKSVKIPVPALSSFDEEDDEPAKKKFKTTGKSLFSVLPPPKNLSSPRILVPHTLTKKQPPKPLTKQIPKVKPTTTTVEKVSKGSDEDDDDDDEKGPLSFFTLEEKPLTPPPAVSTVPSNEVTYGGRFKKPHESAVDAAQLAALEQEAIQIQMDMEDEVPFPDDEDAIPIQPIAAAAAVDDNAPFQLDSEMFQKLQGRRQRGKEEVNFIDVSVAEEMPSPAERTKQLTEETSYASKSKGGPPSSQARRKHQITYLAFQAKERELELKNQWAQNRLTKRQTQSKYGF